ncbi:type II toxin-antitoxin system HipA family toxin [Pontibacter harenae]|uniref:type II toxin-antitoxin system HipA family toxin n=1 Tax=Pontibacter harenae TaxID=2894083 RepID=UPI001E2DFF1A|nr:HipA domain-containing protein [Pontibacter harenae]MCC9167989.1 HipA domain-containing protein [Pontibacter harenae]
MSLPDIQYCPGTLALNFHTYSSACLRNMFSGKKVSHILSYLPPQESEADAAQFMENRKRISISGVQEKLSLLLEKDKLRLTRMGEQGQYILKPIPRDVKRPDQVPANEHLTMQIARQVYKIQVAENALTFFENGEPAYITKRFDLKSDGTKHRQEDFASLAGRTKHTAGSDFKYEGSYEDIAQIIRKTVPAYLVELEKLFSLILFNYLFSNGDAHLKNFSLIDTEYGDYILSPAYDLICTRLHVDDSYFALKDGLFSGDYETDSFKANGFYAYDDFNEFALMIGLKEKRVIKIINTFKQDYQAVHRLINSSFLRDDIKEEYRNHYLERLKMLNYSMEKRN